MPHKHTRKGEDKTTLDLPPSIIAKPLSVSKSANSNGIFTSELTNSKRNGDTNSNSKKRKRNKDAQDDTPKAFARLMAFQSGKRLPNGLDDGVKISKAEKKRKRKLAEDAEDAAAGGGDNHNQDAKTTKIAEGKGLLPTIRVGERMSEFSARVDAALPLSGLINKTGKGGKDPLGLKVARTKTEKKMHRMYAEWREQDKKIKEKREEALELAEEEAMDEDENGQVKWKADIEDTAGAAVGKKKGKGKKRKKMLGEMDDGDDDPWAQVKKNRAEAKVGLHDVVQAPPTFANIPKMKFRDRGDRAGVDNIPNASGSLRRREELSEVRKSVVESYRAMMKGGRAEPEQ